ncbi:MAG: 30S ribosome-binding factor RbfA [Endomicrobium sp.]|jgi:ribosome-binding factor A|nr:30S ribosome-binding factor RbfA [Endomicrobium sp.]
MPLLYKRSVRVGELIYQTIAEIVRKMECLDAKLVTITGAKLTNDLLNCKIYYSVFGVKEDKEKAGKVLKENTKRVKHQLALHLNLRRIPAISFIYDDTNENASKVFDLLKKIEEES